MKIGEIRTKNISHYFVSLLKVKYDNLCEIQSTEQLYSKSMFTQNLHCISKCQSAVFYQYSCGFSVTNICVGLTDLNV